jgi:hypothetical protein
MGRLTRDDSSRIGIASSSADANLARLAAEPSRSSRGFRRRDRDHSHAHNELYAAAAVHLDCTEGANGCAGHGRICTDTEWPLFVGKPPKTDAVITSAQEPSQFRPLHAPSCMCVHACASAWV